MAIPMIFEFRNLCFLWYDTVASYDAIVSDDDIIHDRGINTYQTIVADGTPMHRCHVEVSGHVCHCVVRTMFSGASKRRG